jgi:hypothetical protein
MEGRSNEKLKGDRRKQSRTVRGAERIERRMKGRKGVTKEYIMIKNKEMKERKILSSFISTVL